MRVRSAVLFVAIVCLLPIAAAADISSISPQSIAFGNVEEFLSIFGSGLSGTESTLVMFDGPGGQFVLEPSNFLPGPEGSPHQYPEDHLIVWIPVGVAIVAGPYNVTVVATDFGGTPVTLGPVTFTVEAESFDGPPLISSSEILIEEATSSAGAIVNFDVSAQNPNGDPVPVRCSPASGSQFPMGSTVVTCSATNSFGTSTASIYVVVVDFTPPVVTVPDNINSTTSEVTFAASAVDQIDGVVPVVCSPSSGSTFPAGVTQVVCRAADSSANVGFGIFTVTLAGGLPVITVPDDITVDSPDGGPVVVPYTVTATNGAAITCLYAPGVPFEGNLFYVGTTTLTCTATNLTGSDTKSFTVTVNDLSTPPPVLTVPADITAEATSSAGAAVNFTVTATNGGIIVCSATSGSTFGLGLTTVNCTATNAGGTDADSFNVTVVDTTAPVLTLPDDITADATGPSGAVVIFAASGVDIVDGVIAATCLPASGSTFSIGTTPVSCTVTDLSGNSASGAFNVIVRDITPVLTVPADITTEATSSAGAAVNFTVTATNGGIIVCSATSGSTFPLGPTTVSCTATNASGSDTETFKVTVVDTTPPVLALPADITAEATSASGAVVTYTASASDLVGGNVAVQCTPASGSTFAVGTTLVSCSASDASGNSASDSFTVTVVDTTPPVLVLPADITAEASSASGSVVTYTASASDLVDGNVAVQCTPASGSTFALGTTLVLCSASDASGNSANDSFSVTVVDTTPPQILSVDASPGVLWPPNHKMVDISVVVVAVDAVDPNPVSHIISVTSSQPVNGTGDGDTAPDWVITGPLTVQLRAERSQGVDRTYTITVETVDDAGNRTTATDTVIVTQTKRRAVH